jgi:predicted nucleic acid-binding protein
MAWVEDTSVVLDLVTGDPQFEPGSTLCLQNHLSDGLVVCPVSFIELGPAFAGDDTAADAFLNGAGIATNEPWTSHDTALAHRLWNDYQKRRRQSVVARRPVADVIIAAFPSRFQGIITRNASDFRSILPTLALVEP